MTYYGDTHIGKVRKKNEDTFIAQTIWNKTMLLCAAIDGIGGHYGGDVAAEVARNTIISNLEDFPVWDFSEYLQQAVIEANNVVMLYKNAMPIYREMGCVLSVGVIDIKERCLYIAHIGDTRIYTLHDGQLSLLTRDEAQGNLVTNYIGKHRVLLDSHFCDVHKLQLAPATTLLFCSDGLWKMVDEGNIKDILSLKLSPKGMCNRLISLANKKGGIDNITAVVVKL